MYVLILTRFQLNLYEGRPFHSHFLNIANTALFKHKKAAPKSVQSRLSKKNIIFVTIAQYPEVSSKTIRGKC